MGEGRDDGAVEGARDAEDEGREAGAGREESNDRI